MEFLNLLALSLIVFLIPWSRNFYFATNASSTNQVIKTRLVFFDFIKGLAIIAVILIHVAYFYNTFPYPDNNWLFIYLLNNLARFAIPLFIICSAILLNPLKDKSQIIDFYGRKLWRIFVPYLLVTVVYAYVNQWDFFQYLYNLITGSTATPFYFVIVLLQLYIIFPFLNQIKDSPYFLPITFLISFISCLVPQLRYWEGMPIFLEFLFFFAYGLHCRGKFLNYKAQKQELTLWWGIIIFYFVLIVIKPEWYYNVRLFYGLAIFNLLFYYRDKFDLQNILSKLIISCGQNSLWIYLTHFALVYFFYHLFSLLYLNYYLSFFLIFVSSFITSVALAKVIQIYYQYFLFNIFKIETKR